MGTLPGWNKRLKLTIDQTKIDTANQENFPVLAYLSAASGITSADVSCIFDELDYPSVDDAFTGTNGSAPNSDLWTETDADNIADIQSNKFNVAATGSVDKVAQVRSNYLLSGNFDIQVDFDITTLDQPAADAQYPCTLKIWDGVGSKVSRIGRLYLSGGTNGYFKDGTDDAWAAHANADSSGKLRLIRTGSTIKGYYWRNSQWEWDGDTAGFTFLTTTSNDVTVLLWSKQESGAALDANYDNFTVTSGSIVWPQKTHPNRKKIVLTTSDGVTQCYAEIGRWDAANEKAWLWVKVPSVAYNSDTDLYIYYDKDHADNTTYVGDTESTPAQNVWDANFVGVWHMGQDPNGDPADAIKDSTTNANHGTPGGSMTSADLVDGKIGKALDFDGLDDHVACGDFGNFDQSDSWTISAIVKKVVDASGAIVGKHNKSVTDGFMYESRGGGEHKQAAYLTSDVGVNYSFTIRRMGSVSLNDGLWHDTVFTYNGSGIVFGIKFFTDGTEDSYTDVATGDISSGITSATPINIGRLGSADSEIDADIDEVRISNIVRAAPWNKATYHSNWDSLITFGAEETLTTNLFDGKVKIKDSTTDLFDGKVVVSDWLSGWDKRLKLTVDETKVDTANQENFPVLAYLSAASGITSADVSCIFDELDYPSVDDAFTGPDGSSPDSDKWYNVTSNLATIVSNELKLYKPSGSGQTNAQVNSHFRIAGDFDIQVDYDLPNGIPGSKGGGIRFYAQSPSGYIYVERKNGAYSNQYYYINCDGSDNGYGSATTDTSGKFRITRVGTTLAGYYWGGASWVLLKSFASKFTDEVQIKFKIWNYSAYPEIDARLDNFTVTSGSIVWPQKTHPNRKKIALTTSDGVTQCYTEIERWDDANEKAWLWVKVPSVAYNSDTDLYIYYDKDHADNTTYVGDTGSTPAQTVWDINFVGVWHMGQDPNGDPADAIKDSTSNAKHGTPGGSMTSGDLVDGKIGKALDFDGTDDIVKCGGETLVPSTGYTFEGIINVSSSLTHNSYIVINQRSGDASFANLLWLYYSAPDLKLELTCTTTGIDRVGAYETDIDRNTLVSVAGIYKGDQTAPLVYRNGVDVTVTKTDGNGLDITDDTGYICIGGRSYDNIRNIQALVDEVRISNIARSAPWIKATYHSNWDTLITFGSEENKTTNFFDGKVKIKDSTTDLFDGKVRIKDVATDLFDGKVVIAICGTDLFDGKVKVKDSVTDLFDGKAIIARTAVDLFDGKVIIARVAHTDVDSGISGKGYSDVDSGVLGAPVLQAFSGIRGLVEDITFQVNSGIKGIFTKELDIDSALAGLAKAECSSGILGLAAFVANSGIIGGEADVFGFSYPLADPMPLRNTTIWGSFKNVQTIHHAYGRVRLAPIPYEKTGKFFVMADHGIQGVDAIEIDDTITYAWKFTNTLDSSNSPVAMLELGEALPEGSSLVALIRGKVHPTTGVLLTNPADVLWDILANVVGAPVPYADLDRFRVECAIYGIEIHGLLDDRTRSIKKQLDLITESIGAIWSGGMPGLARIYPVDE